MLKSYHLIKIVVIALLVTLCANSKSSVAGVNPLTGHFSTRQADLILTYESIQIEISRSFHSNIFSLTTGKKSPQWFFHPFQKHLIPAADGEKIFLQDEQNIVVFEKADKKDSFKSAGGEKISVVKDQFLRRLINGQLEIYSPEGKLTRIAYPYGKTLNVIYDNNMVAKIILDNKELLRYSYSSQGLVEKIQAYTGALTRYQYDSRGRLTEVVNENNMITLYEYDEQNRIERINYQTGDYVDIKYDSSTGRVRRTTKKDGLNRYKYSQTKDGNINRVDITYPTGKVRIELVDKGRISKTTDSAGNQTEKHYNENGLLARHIDAKGHTVEYEYDSLKRLASLTYPDNGKENYAYLNTTALIAKRTFADGSEKKFFYNDRKQLAKVTGPGDTEISYQYNNQGLIEAVFYSKDKKRFSKFKYDERGFLVEARDPLNRIRRYQRDAKGRVRVQIDPAGRTVTYQYNEFGLLTEITDWTGATYQRIYDRRLRLMETIDQQGLRTRFSYDENGNLQSVVYPRGLKATYAYDDSGRLKSISDSAGRYQSYDYNTSGLKSKIMASDGSATRFRYDALGNLIEEQNSLGHATQWRYDAMNRLIAVEHPGKRRHDYIFDQAGRLEAEKDAAGAVKHYFYDSAGNLKKIVLPGKEETAYSFEADSYGSASSIKTSDGRRYEYTHDAVGRPMQQVMPWGEKIQYRYDLADNLIKKASSSGKILSYRYDVANRLRKIISSYGLTESFEYDPKGNLIKVAGRDFEKHLAYNEYGEVISENYPLLGITVKHSFDILGNRIRLEVPGYLKIYYEYDQRGRMTKITYNDNKKDKTVRIEYDTLGRKTQISYPNGIKIQYKYNPAGFLQKIAYSDSKGEVIEYYQYDYDRLARVTAIKDAKGNDKKFKYDDNGQLIKASSNGKKTKFTYGPSFKRIARTDSNGKTTFRYNSAGQLIAAAGTKIHYGPSGQISRRIKDGTETNYGFDSLDRLSVIQTPSQKIEYTYSPEGQRVGKTIDSQKTYYIYDDYNLLMVLDEKKTPIQTFIHADEIDSPLVVLKNNASFFYLSDHRRSTDALIDESGKITTRYEYEPFGKFTRQGEEIDQRLTYTGRFYDDESGLYYYRARFYDPELGIFLSPDPYQKTLEFPQVFNDYAYVQNDPVNLIDPLGLFFGPAIGNKIGQLGAPAPDLTGVNLNSPAFWNRMANHAEWLESQFGPNIANDFRQKLNQELAKKLPNAPKPGILDRVLGPVEDFAKRTWGRATRIWSRIRNPGSSRLPTSIQSAGAGNVTGAGNITGSASNTGAGRVTRMGPASQGQGGLTGRSSFGPGSQQPGFWGQSVGWGQRVGGGITGILVGGKVGSEWAEWARQQGRSLTPWERAKSAAESAGRAVGAVLTAGTSETWIWARKEDQKIGEAVARADTAEETLQESQRIRNRKGADRIAHYKQKAVDLVTDAKELKPRQEKAIAEAQSWYSRAQEAAKKLDNYQTIADNPKLCGETRGKIAALGKLPDEAQSFKEPVIGNTNIAKINSKAVCDYPQLEDSPGLVDVAVDAAGLAKGQAGAIGKIANRAKGLQSEINEGITQINKNNAAIAKAQALMSELSALDAEVQNRAAKAWDPAMDAKTYTGKCQILEAQVKTAYDITKAAPESFVVADISIEFEDAADIRATKAAIASSLTEIRSVCQQIRSNENKGQWYAEKADAFAGSVTARANKLKAKIKLLKPCNIKPPAAGLVGKLFAVAGAAKKLAATAESSVKRARQCLASAPAPPPAGGTGRDMGEAWGGRETTRGRQVAGQRERDSNRAAQRAASAAGSGAGNAGAGGTGIPPLIMGEPDKKRKPAASTPSGSSSTSGTTSTKTAAKPPVPKAKYYILKYQASGIWHYTNYKCTLTSYKQIVASEKDFTARKAELKQKQDEGNKICKEKGCNRARGPYARMWYPQSWTLTLHQGPLDTRPKETPKGGSKCTGTMTWK